ncbi:MAG: hypothetical protein KGL95_13065 [Patescibacteria group bacterium]|nr:hypothetical protein [Patescibacteria group bacterium]
MIGKIIAIVVLVFGFVAYTGINAVPYYQTFTTIRNDVQPLGDNVMEKALNATSHLDLKDKIGNIGGKI